jgi:hypothetical protein
MRSRCEGASQPNAPGMPKIIAPANRDVAYFFALVSITATRRPVSAPTSMALTCRAEESSTASIADVREMSAYHSTSDVMLSRSK